MPILKEHIFNLTTALSVFNDSFKSIRNIETFAHWNFKNSNKEEDLTFNNEIVKLSVFECGVDNNGNTQYLFCKPFDTNIYYISCVTDYKNQCNDKVIFCLSFDDE